MAWAVSRLFHYQARAENKQGETITNLPVQILVLTNIVSHGMVSSENHKNPSTKFGESMILSDAATVRTGFVSGRRRAQGDETQCNKYQLLNLRCISNSGILNTVFAELFSSSSRIKEDFLSQKGDVLIRLSAPYSSVMIQDEAQCGFLIPSHFAIIRARGKSLLPEYILWQLRRNKTKMFILQNSSGSSAFGTISSGFLASLQIEELPLKQQHALGQLTLLNEREQELLDSLAKEKREYFSRLTENAFAEIERGKRDDDQTGY